LTVDQPVHAAKPLSLENVGELVIDGAGSFGRAKVCVYGDAPRTIPEADQAAYRPGAIGIPGELQLDRCSDSEPVTGLVDVSSGDGKPSPVPSILSHPRLA
jgi:hypothetical protein